MADTRTESNASLYPDGVVYINSFGCACVTLGLMNQLGGKLPGADSFATLSDNEREAIQAFVDGGSNALDRAIMTGNPSRVRAYIEEGAQLTDNSIYLAIFKDSSKDSSMVEVLLEKFPDDEDRRRLLTEGAVDFALRTPSPMLKMKLLLVAGAPIHANTLALMQTHEHQEGMRAVLGTKDAGEGMSWRQAFADHEPSLTHEQPPAARMELRQMGLGPFDFGKHF
jgi:hypothetical protein